MTTQNVKTESHFFASFGLGWATAATRKEAIEKLINSFRSELKTMAANGIKENLPGAYIWSTEVMRPDDYAYAINFFSPVDVPMENSAETYVTRVTAKAQNYFTVGIKLDLIK